MLDAIIISDSGDDTLSASSPLRLHLDGKIASIQRINHFMTNGGRINEPVPGENRNNWHCAPKLNGIRLFSYLQRQGHDVALIDSYGREKAVFLKLLQDTPKAVIISTTFIINKAVLYELARDIRSHAPDIKIIAGGPFILSSFLLHRRADTPGYDILSPKDDYLFLNEDNRPDIDLYVVDKGGEDILSRILSDLKNGKSLKDVPNTAYWTGLGYRFNERRASAPEDFCIDWENLPDHVFKYGVVNVQASIGCPYQCKFCNFIKDHNYNYIKPLPKLVHELKSIARKGVKYVRFVDDNFRLGKKDLADVCRTFIDEDIDLKWMSFIRASALNSMDPELLKNAGCIETQMGVESADEMILRNMNKDANPVMYNRVITALLDSGIDCSCCFIFGFPGETDMSIRKTVDFIESVPRAGQEGIFYWSIYPFILIPLSEIYAPETRSEYDLDGYMDQWSHASMVSEQAKHHIIKAFLEIRNSSPIYSNDDIAMLKQLGVEKRKQFVLARHNLAKQFINQPFDAKKTIETFADLLPVEGTP